jgi:hypothetical protein
MKRLKIPRIPTRIPLPNLPSVRRSSRQAKDKSSISVTLPPEAEERPDVKSVDQTKEANEVEHRKVNVPKIPLPSISKPSMPKLHVPKIPLPSVSKPGVPKLSVPKIPLPSVSMPKISKISSTHKEKGKLIIEKSDASMATSESDSSKSEQPEIKERSKFSIHKISMPNLKPSKVGMPSLSLGKGSAKSTGKRILALTIEGTDVRLVSYHNNAIESWKSVSFDAHLLKMGQVADPEGLGEVIKDAITGIETNRCYVVCALPGLRSVSRIITIPNVGKKELDSVVPREVRRTMTVSEEDNYFHWQILPSETEMAQTKVFLLAVPKEPMSLLLRAFSHAGINPSNIDLKPLSLMRAVNQKDAIIANCEGNSMEIVIVSDDIPVLIRSVFLGEGVANQDYAIGRISDELGRTIVTYNEINKEHPLDQNTPVYLTGAAAAGVPFALNVAALTRRTVQPLESPIPLPADLPIADYMVNIGLILKVV